MLDSPPLLEHGEVDGTLAVDPDDVGLDGRPVLHPGNIRHEHLGRPGDFQGNPGDLIHGVELAVRLDRVVGRADHDIASRKDRVRPLEGCDHIHQAQLPGLELHGIDIDHDLPVFAAEWLGYRRARCSGYLVTDIKLAEVAQLRLVKALPRQRDQADGEAGSVELQYHRREGAGREPSQVRHREV